MSWISIILSAVGSLYEQWSAANDAQKAQIEAAALTAVQGMLAAAQTTGAAHDTRTAATEAAIAADTPSTELPTDPGTPTAIAAATEAK